MARKRKTPPELAQVLMKRHEELLDHLEEMLRVKHEVPVENQASHIRDRTEAEMIARMDGYNACLEDVMRAFNCYAGFSYAGPTRIDPATGYKSRSLFDSTEAAEADSYYKTDITKAPRFAEWRRLYFTNGITKK